MGEPHEKPTSGQDMEKPQDNKERQKTFATEYIKKLYHLSHLKNLIHSNNAGREEKDKIDLKKFSLSGGFAIEEEKIKNAISKIEVVLKHLNNPKKPLPTKVNEFWTNEISNENSNFNKFIEEITGILFAVAETMGIDPEDTTYTSKQEKNSSKSDAAVEAKINEVKEKLGEVSRTELRHIIGSINNWFSLTKDGPENSVDTSTTLNVKEAKKILDKNGSSILKEKEAFEKILKFLGSKKKEIPDDDEIKVWKNYQNRRGSKTLDLFKKVGMIVDGMTNKTNISKDLGKEQAPFNFEKFKDKKITSEEAEKARTELTNLYGREELQRQRDYFNSLENPRGNALFLKSAYARLLAPNNEDIYTFLTGNDVWAIHDHMESRKARRGTQEKKKLNIEDIKQEVTETLRSTEAALSNNVYVISPDDVEMLEGLKERLEDLNSKIESDQPSEARDNQIHRTYTWLINQPQFKRAQEIFKINADKVREERNKDIEELIKLIGEKNVIPLFQFLRQQYISKPENDGGGYTNILQGIIHFDDLDKDDGGDVLFNCFSRFYHAYQNKDYSELFKDDVIRIKQFLDHIGGMEGGILEEIHSTVEAKNHRESLEIFLNGKNPKNEKINTEEVKIKVQNVLNTHILSQGNEFYLSNILKTLTKLDDPAAIILARDYNLITNFVNRNTLQHIEETSKNKLTERIKPVNSAIADINKVLNASLIRLTDEEREKLEEVLQAISRVKEALTKKEKANDNDFEVWKGLRNGTSEEYQLIQEKLKERPKGYRAEVDSILEKIEEAEKRKDLRPEDRQLLASKKAEISDFQENIVFQTGMSEEDKAKEWQTIKKSNDNDKFFSWLNSLLEKENGGDSGGKREFTPAEKEVYEKIGIDKLKQINKETYRQIICNEELFNNLPRSVQINIRNVARGSDKLITIKEPRAGFTPDPLTPQEYDLLIAYHNQIGIYKIIQDILAGKFEVATIVEDTTTSKKEVPPPLKTPPAPEEPPAVSVPLVESERVISEREKKYIPTIEPEKQKYIEDSLKILGMSLNEFKRLPGFKEIAGDPGRQLFVIENLKHVWHKHIVDEAEKRHEDAQKSKGKIKRLWGNIVRDYRVEKNKTAISKEKFNLNNFKDEATNLIHIASAGPKFDLQPIKNKKGEGGYRLIGQYIDPDFVKRFNVGFEEAHKFNVAATNLADMPTELDVKHMGSSARKKFVQAKAEYEKEKVALLAHIARQKGIDSEREAETLSAVNELEFNLLMHQTLVQHPEIEKALRNIQDNKAPFKQAFVGGMAIGIAARMASRTILGPLGGFLAAGTFGYFRGKAAGHRTIEKQHRNIKERKVEFQRGRKSKFDEEKWIDRLQKFGEGDRLNKNFEDSKSLIRKLNFLIDKVDKTKDSRENEDALKARIYFTRKKLLEDSIIWGNSKEALAKKLELMQTLSKAELKVHILESAPRGAKQITVLERLNRVMLKDSQALEERRQRFVKNQGWKGAAIGVGGGALGYVSTHVGIAGIDTLMKLKNGVAICDHAANVIEAGAVKDLTNQKIHELAGTTYNINNVTYNYHNGVPVEGGSTIETPKASGAFFDDNNHEEYFNKTTSSTDTSPAQTETSSSAPATPDKITTEEGAAAASAAEALRPKEIPKIPEGVQKFAEKFGGKAVYENGKWNVYVPSEGKSREFWAARLLREAGSKKPAAEAYNYINSEDVDLGEEIKSSRGSLDREIRQHRFVQKNDMMKLSLDADSEKLTTIKPLKVAEVDQEIAKARAMAASARPSSDTTSPFQATSPETKTLPSTEVVKGWAVKDLSSRAEEFGYTGDVKDEAAVSQWAKAKVDTAFEKNPEVIDYFKRRDIIDVAKGPDGEVIYSPRVSDGTKIPNYVMKEPPNSANQTDNSFGLNQAIPDERVGKGVLRAETSPEDLMPKPKTPEVLQQIAEANNIDPGTVEKLATYKVTAETDLYTPFKEILSDDSRFKALNDEDRAIALYNLFRKEIFENDPEGFVQMGLNADNPWKLKPGQTVKYLEHFQKGSTSIKEAIEQISSATGDDRANAKYLFDYPTEVLEQLQKDNNLSLDEAIDKAKSVRRPGQKVVTPAGA
jgi:hypothetical protein